MRKILILLIFGFSNYIYGQQYPAFEKALAKELSSAYRGNDGWAYFAEDAKIQKIEKPLIQQRIPGYEFFQVKLTNFLGYHRTQSTCVVLFDTAKSKILLVEPLWFNDLSMPLLKLFIGKRFDSKESLLGFLNELNELMQIGSGYKFVNTSVSGDSITYDLGYFSGDSYTVGGSGTSSTTRYNEDGIWRKIRIDVKDFAIVRFISTNPITKEKEIAQ